MGEAQGGIAARARIPLRPMAPLPVLVTILIPNLSLAWSVLNRVMVLAYYSATGDSKWFAAFWWSAWQA